MSRAMTRDRTAEDAHGAAQAARTLDAVSRRERMSISMTPDERQRIETAAKAAGMSVSAWIVRTANEEARWAVARQIAEELANEAGVTDEDRKWAASVMGLDTDD